MRCVSVVERLELDASVGSVMPAAICVDDVDNDGTNELAVGTIDGCVYIYKFIGNTKPWCQWSCSTANEGKWVRLVRWSASGPLPGQSASRRSYWSRYT